MKKPPKVYISMPTYDLMQVSTCLSLVKLFNKFTIAKIPAEIGTFKCPYVGYGRNVLTAMFLESGFDYQLFVDSDLEFEKEIISEKANSYFYNFWDTTFGKDGTWWGEDVNFCNLIKKSGFKFYGIVDGKTTHHGNYGWTGSLADGFKKVNGKDQ
jgi:hypothetical protein